MSNSEAPRTIGNVVLLECIGRGGMGEVWRGERVSAGDVRKRVAVKRILASYQRDPTLRARFVAEARTTARLEHPNIVQLVDFGDAPELYLVLEYVEGTSLDKMLARAARGVAPFPLAAALYVLAEAAEGLDYAHRRTDEQGRPLGIVHRDVSPHNVLISTDGAVKVSDFGIAWAADNQVRTREGFTLGKVLYMSPQQAQALPLDRRADVFSLGVVLWESLTLQGLLPRGAPDAALAALAAGKFPPPSSVVPDLPPVLDAIAREALAVDLDARMPSAGRLAASLRAVLDEVAPGFSSQDLARVVADLMPEWRHRRGAAAPSDPEAPAARLPADPPAIAPAAPPANVSARPGPAEPVVPSTRPQPPSARALVDLGGEPGAAPVVAPPVRVVAPGVAPGAASARPWSGPPPAAPRARGTARLAAAAALVVLAGCVLVALFAVMADRSRERQESSSFGAAPQGAVAAGLPPAPPIALPAPMMPPPPPQSNGAPEAQVSSVLLSTARACAESYAFRGPVTGTAMLDAQYAPGGELVRASVRVEGTRLNHLMAGCIQRRLREQPISPTPAGVTLAGFTVGF